MQRKPRLDTTLPICLLLTTHVKPSRLVRIHIGRCDAMLPNEAMQLSLLSSGVRVPESKHPI